MVPHSGARLSHWLRLNFNVRPHNTSRMARRRDLLLLGFCSSTLSGCAREPDATKALRAIGISYKLPPGWTQEDDEDKRAVFMLSPETRDGVAATAMIELPKERDPRTIPRLLRERSEELGQKYPDYAELQRESNFRIGTNFYGMLAYTVTKKQVPLTEQYLLLDLRPGRTVLVFTSIATDVISDYRDAVQGLLLSIRVAPR